MRALADANGTIVDHAVYDAFGRALGATTDAAIDSLFGYTGRPLDEATGLQNNHHRWYEATTGKWLSQDPIGFSAGDANLYRYVGNGPATRIDPSGLAESPEFDHTLEYPRLHGDIPEVVPRSLTGDDLAQALRDVEVSVHNRVLDQGE